MATFWLPTYFIGPSLHGDIEPEERMKASMKSPSPNLEIGRHVFDLLPVVGKTGESVFGTTSSLWEQAAHKKDLFFFPTLSTHLI